MTASPKLPTDAMVPSQEGWKPIETAPFWISRGDEALVGQLNSDGRWVKVSLWAAAWSRESVAHRGATHWLKLPAFYDDAFDAGLEAAARYHDGESERIRQICRPLTLAPVASIYAHDEAAVAIRALKRGAPSEG